MHTVAVRSFGECAVETLYPPSTKQTTRNLSRGSEAIPRDTNTHTNTSSLVSLLLRPIVIPFAPNGHIFFSPGVCCDEAGFTGKLECYPNGWGGKTQEETRACEFVVHNVQCISFSFVARFYRETMALEFGVCDASTRRWIRGSVWCVCARECHSKRQEMYGGNSRGAMYNLIQSTHPTASETCTKDTHTNAPQRGKNLGKTDCDTNSDE